MKVFSLLSVFGPVTSDAGDNRGAGTGCADMETAQSQQWCCSCVFMNRVDWEEVWRQVKTPVLLDLDVTWRWAGVTHVVAEAEHSSSPVINSNMSPDFSMLDIEIFKPEACCESRTRLSAMFQKEQMKVWWGARTRPTVEPDLACVLWMVLDLFWFFWFCRYRSGDKFPR